MATTAIKNVDNRRAMKNLIANPELNTRMEAMLGRNAGTFLASVLDLYTSDNLLANCNPNEVMQEAMKAAALHLPVVKSLGFAYLVPFKDRNGVQHPNFVLGYKGLIQLAMRTGHYKTINAGAIYEGETVIDNRITGEVRLEGKPTSDKAIGYFAHFSMVNGFEKTEYWTREKVLKHAKAKSKSYKVESSPWHTDFDAMAEKTLIRNLLGKYGELSVDMVTAFVSDNDNVTPTDNTANAEVLSLPEEAAPIPAEAEITAVNEPVDNSSLAPAAAATPDASVMQVEQIKVPF